MSSSTIWRRISLLFVLAMVLSMAAATVSAQSVSEVSSKEGDVPSKEGDVPTDPKPPQPLRPVMILSSKHDLSPPLRSIAPKPPTPGEPWEIPFYPLPKALKGGSQGPLGPVLQDRPGTLQMPSPLLSVEGLSNADNQTYGGGRVMPPDTQGDVSPNHYIQWVNVVFGIWDKNGNRLYGPAAGNTLWSGFGGPCETTNDGDPITLYDHLADRWLMSQFALPNFPNGPFYQCIAISASPDPTGSWYRYEFVWPNNKMNDYPKFGVWPDAYYLTVNQFAAGTLSWAGAGVAAFEREKMLQGLPARMVYFDLYSVNPDFGGMLPADLDGPPPPPGTPGLFAEWDDSAWIGPQDALRLWEFRVDWNNPSNSTFGINGQPNLVIPTADVDPNLCNYSRNCIPQPSTAQRLDAISDRLMYRLQYRNFGTYQVMLSNHTVDADGTDRAGIHWFELRNDGTGWTMYQQGVYAPADGLHRWMASIAMDRQGNIALGYSVSSSSVYPSIRYTGRLASDPLGQMTQGEATLASGTNYQYGGNRWGDYSMMAVDPVDGCTFWYTQEYINSPPTSWGNWNTRFGAFRYPSCMGATGILSGTVIRSGSGTPIIGAKVQAAGQWTFIALSQPPNGAYSLQIPTGTYTVTASAYGYRSATVTGVQVHSGTVTTVNFQLEPAATYVVSGTVTDARTGWPLYAQINIAGYPGGSIWNNPVTGFYSVTLVEGITYTFQVTAWVSGYLLESRSVGPLTGDRTENFRLNVDSAACSAPGYDYDCRHLENFELTNGGYIAGGTNSSWAWGTPTSGPGAARSGTKVWATNLAGNYNNNENSTLTSPNIDLSALAGRTIILSWWQWLQTEEDYDFAYVDVSKDGGATWTTVYGPVSGDVNLTWTRRQVVLDPSYAVSNFRVRFRFTSDSSIVYPGWYVDDVCISPGPPLTTVYTQGFELTNGGYIAGGTNSSWAWGTPTSGPGAARSGTKVWATNLAGNYNNNENSTLTSPNIDLSALAGRTIILSWWQWLQTEEDYDFAYVDVSKDGGATWTTVYGPVSGDVNLTWTRRQVVLDPSYAVSNFRVRFRFTSDSSIVYPGWYVDDVEIAVGPPAEICVPAAGGLVVGNVYDANTGAPLTGAQVANDSGRTFTAAATADPAVDDAFFTLFSPAGNRVFTATMPGGYVPHVRTVTVVASSTVSANFSLQAGYLSYTPSRLEVTLEMGSIATLPLTLTNSGGVAASFEWRELKGGVIPLGPFDEPGFGVKPFRRNLPSAEGLPLPPLPEAPPLAAGNVITSWKPIHPSTTAWGIAYDGENRTVWVGDGWGPLDRTYEYRPDGTSTGRSWPYAWPVGPYGPADFTFNWNTGQLWVMNVSATAAANCIYEIDPASGYTGRSICPGGGFSVSQRGLAYDPDTDTYLAGGWNDMRVHRFDSAGNILQQVNVGLPIAGLAYNADTKHLFVMVNAATTRVYVLDAANNFATIGQLTITQGFTRTYAGAGLEIDCNGNLWAVDQETDIVYQFESGESTTMCTTDVPWLSVRPISGTVPPGGAQVIQVTFNAGVPEVNQHGRYHAQLKVVDDTPYRLATIPVTMTVVSYGVALTPTADAKTGRPGEHVLYTLTVTNAGSVTDTFTVALSGNNWMTQAPPEIGPLASRASATFVVTVTVPSNALAGASDTVTVTVSSRGNPARSAQSRLTTTALAVYGLRLAPTADAKSGRPGAVVTYTLTVTNTGNATDTYTVTVSNNAWTTTAPTTVGPVAPGSRATFQVTVTVPANAPAGASDTATVRVTSRADPTKQAQSTLTTTALAVYGLRLAPTADAKSGRPGAVVTYTLTVTNTGNATDTYTVTVSNNAWTTTAPTTVGPVAPGSRATFQVTVTVPPSLTGADTDTALVKVISRGDATKSAQAVLTTTQIRYRLYLPLVMRNFPP